MSLSEGLFRDVRRSNARLAELGIDREVLEPSLAAVAALQQAQLDHRPDLEIAAAVVDAHWDPPRVGEVRRRSREQGSDHVVRSGVDSASGRPLRRSVRVPVEWDVTGNPRWLMWWPDETTQDPVDVIFPPPDTTNDLDRAEWNRLVELSSNLFLLTDAKVTSFVEVPIDPDESIDAGTAVRQAIEDRDTLLRGYVDAIEPTATRERSRVVATVADVVRRRRAELSWFDDIDEGLTLIPQSIDFEVESSTRPVSATEDRRTRDLAVLPQITTATFDAIVDHILRWRNKVEQYPSTFAALGENACSDVLAACLALTFKVAEREVFACGGKTDIYVPLAALHPEIRDALTTYYFYAEAKMGTGSVLAKGAWAQADSYRALRVRRAVLLFYVTAKDLVSAAERTLEAFRGHGAWRKGAVSELPPMVYRFLADRDSLGQLELTIIVIHTQKSGQGTR